MDVQSKEEEEETRDSSRPDDSSHDGKNDNNVKTTDSRKTSSSDNGTNQNCTLNTASDSSANQKEGNVGYEKGGHELVNGKCDMYIPIESAPSLPTVEKKSPPPPPLVHQHSSVHKVQFADEEDIPSSSGDDSDNDDDLSDVVFANSPSKSSLRANLLQQRNLPRQQQRRHRRTISESSYYSSVGSSSLSRTSSDDDDDSGSSSDSYSFIAPDGGWGWVIVAASFMVNMIADGVTFSFGVLFVELQNEFEESKAVTAGVVSLFHAVPLLSGPIASALTDRYGCRRMTILGSILATIGFLLSSFCYRLELLYLTFGLIAGFGLSLCYVAAIVIVAYYFDRKRSFATGIAVCGSGVGTFIFAPFTQFLIEEYGGWRGATVILAGCFLNICICGALFRDLAWSKNSSTKRRKLRKRGSFGSVSNYSSAMPEIEEIKAILETGDVTALFSQEELDEYPRLSSSLVNIPTYISRGEKLPDEVLNALAKNHEACAALLQHYPDTLMFGSSSCGSVAIDIKGAAATDAANDLKKQQQESIDVKLKRKVSSLFKKRPSKSILKRPPSSRPVVAASAGPSRSFSEPRPQQQQPPPPTPQQNNSTAIRFHSDVHAQKTMNLHHLKLRRQSLTYRGAMLSINRYRLRADSCPDIYRNSMATLPPEEEDESFICLRKFFSQCCRWNFFNPPFVIFCFSNFILYAWYDVMYVYLVDYTEKDLHYDTQDATFLISMIGILNTLGEVIIGYCGDRSWMNMNLLYAVCMLACGLSTAAVPFLTAYGHLATMAGIYGFAISANYSLTSPILVELVSLEQFSNAYGLLLLVQGISNLVGPPFAGYLYDLTEEWYFSFVLAGVFIMLSGLLLLILPCAKRARRIRERHLSQLSEFNNEGQEVRGTPVVPNNTTTSIV